MTQTSWPISGQGMTEAQWRELVATVLTEGVKGVPGGTSLQVFADSTGLQVKVRVGAGYVQGFAYDLDAQLTLAVGANANPNPRTDYVVLRYTPGAGVLLAVKAGAPAVTPVPPALEVDPDGVWELPLALIAVPGGSPTTITAGEVTDARRYAGQEIVPCLSTSRPAGSFGLVIYEVDTGRLYIFDGSDWAPFNRDLTSFSMDYTADWTLGGTIDRLTSNIIDAPAPRLLVASWEGFTPSAGAPDLVLITISILRNGSTVRSRNVRVRLRDLAVIQGGGSFTILDNDYDDGAIYKLRFVRSGTAGGTITAGGVSLDVIPQPVVPGI